MKPALEALREKARAHGDDGPFIIGVTTGYLAKIELGDYPSAAASRRHAG